MSEEVAQGSTFVAFITILEMDLGRDEMRTCLIEKGWLGVGTNFALMVNALLFNVAAICFECDSAFLRFQIPSRLIKFSEENLGKPQGNHNRLWASPEFNVISELFRRLNFRPRFNFSFWTEREECFGKFNPICDGSNDGSNVPKRALDHIFRNHN